MISSRAEEALSNSHLDLANNRHYGWAVRTQEG